MHLVKQKKSQLIYKGTKICLPFAFFEKIEFMVIQVLTFFYIVIVKSVMVLSTAHDIFRCKVLGVFTVYLRVNINLQIYSFKISPRLNICQIYRKHYCGRKQK